MVCCAFRNQPVDIYANPVYGVADVTVPPPIYKGPFMDYTDYTVNQDRNTPSGSRKGGYGGGGGDSPSAAGDPVVEATQQKKAAYPPPVNGNHSWNSSEV